MEKVRAGFEATWGKGFPGQRNNKCKDPEAGRSDLPSPAVPILIHCEQLPGKSCSLPRGLPGSPFLHLYLILGVGKMPAMGPLAAAFMASLMDECGVSWARRPVRSTTDTSGVGTWNAIPVSFLEDPTSGVGVRTQ